MNRDWNVRSSKLSEICFNIGFDADYSIFGERRRGTITRLKDLLQFEWKAASSSSSPPSGKVRNSHIDGFPILSNMLTNIIALRSDPPSVQLEYLCQFRPTLWDFHMYSNQGHKHVLGVSLSQIPLSESAHYTKSSKGARALISIPSGKQRRDARLPPINVFTDVFQHQETHVNRKRQTRTWDRYFEPVYCVNDFYPSNPCPTRSPHTLPHFT